MSSHKEIKSTSEAYLKKVKESRGRITLTWYLPLGSKREYDKKVDELYRVLNDDFKVRIAELGVDQEGKVTLVVWSSRDVETVENEIGSDPEFVDFREGDIEIYEDTQNKRRRVDEGRAMSARDFSKRIDSIEDAHQEIKSISEAYRSMISGESADKKGAEESQVNERRGSGPLSARQVSRRADTLSKNISEFENMLKQSKPEGVSSRDYDKAVSDMRSSYLDLMDAIEKVEGMLE